MILFPAVSYQSVIDGWRRISRVLFLYDYVGSETERTSPLESIAPYGPGPSVTGCARRVRYP